MDSIDITLAKLRENVKHGTYCSKCGDVAETKNRYCNKCHGAYMRRWRKSHPLNAEQKKKDSCRSMAYVYYKRGKLIKENCVNCGDPHSQMHHEDYSKPLMVIWLCRPCHLKLHKEGAHA